MLPRLYWPVRFLELQKVLLVPGEQVDYMAATREISRRAIGRRGVRIAGPSYCFMSSPAACSLLVIVRGREVPFQVNAGPGTPGSFKVRFQGHVTTTSVSPSHGAPRSLAKLEMTIRPRRPPSLPAIHSAATTPPLRWWDKWREVTRRREIEIGCLRHKT